MIKPTLLTLIMTENCNFRCKYCFIKFNAKSMSWGIIKNIPAWLNGEGKSIKTIWFFGGEPTLEWDKIKWLINRLGKKYKYGITTNGYILTDEIIRYIKKYNIAINLSYDGLYQEIFRGPIGKRKEAAEKVRENMRRLKKEGISFTILHQVTPEMVDKLLLSVEDALTYSQNVFLNIITDNYHKWGITERQKLIETLRVTYKKHPSVSPMKKFSKWDKLPDRCGAGRGGIALGVDGKFYPCQRFATEHFYPLGDIWSGLDWGRKNIFEDMKADRGIAPCFIGNKERTGSIFKTPDDVIDIYDNIYKIAKEGKNNKKDKNKGHDTIKVSMKGHYVLKINGKKVLEGDNVITDCLLTLIQDRLAGVVDSSGNYKRGINQAYLWHDASTVNYTACTDDLNQCRDLSAILDVSTGSIISEMPDEFMTITSKFVNNDGVFKVYWQYQNNTGADENVGAIGIGGSYVDDNGNTKYELFSLLKLKNTLTLANGDTLSGSWVLEVSTASDDGAAKYLICPALAWDNKWVTLSKGGLFYVNNVEPDTNDYKRATAVLYDVENSYDNTADNGRAITKITARYSFGNDFKGKFGIFKVFIQDKGEYPFGDNPIFSLDFASDTPHSTYGWAKLKGDQWDFYLDPLEIEFTCNNRDNCGATCEVSCQTSSETSCSDTCETSCQTDCETSCQETCELNCQSDCETSCQTSCEITDKSGSVT